MSNKNNILTELKNITQAVANIGNTNVYSVPSFYFDGLSLEILRKINTEELLQQPSSVSSYSVPKNYFENITTEILSKIKNEETTQFSKTNPYTVPSYYFKNLFSEISKTIKSESIAISEEMEMIAPVLNTISKNNVYAVPNNYFNTLNASKSISSSSAKVIRLSSWVKYAVAAIIIGIISITAFTLFTTNNKIATQNSSATINIENELQNFSDDEIIKFLDSHTNGTDAIAQINAPQEDYNSEELLNNFTEEDIEKYLKETNL